METANHPHRVSYAQQTVYDTDARKAISHIVEVIEARGVEKCSAQTQEAYKTLRQLWIELGAVTTIYQP